MQVDIGVTPIEKKDKEMVKVCTMKATGSTNEERSSHGFGSYEKKRQRGTKKDNEEFIEKDLMVNAILGNLIFNWRMVLCDPCSPLHLVG